MSAQKAVKEKVCMTLFSIGMSLGVLNAVWFHFCC